MTRIVAILAAAAVVAGLGLAGFFVLRGGDADRFAACRRGAVAGGAAEIGGPFALSAPDGSQVTEAAAITGPTLVYFGYTFCPDFCPTDLARNALAADLLADRGLDVGQVFITVDPARDTPEVMGDYARAIHPGLLGLSGTADQVAAAARAYRVYFDRAGEDDEFYMMDHSTFTYLMAPETGFLEFFASDAAAEDVAAAAGCFIDNL